MPQTPVQPNAATPPDEPIPVLNADEGSLAAKDHAESDLDPRQVRWNLGALILDVSFFAIGMAFLDMNAVLPLLMDKLGASGLLIGAFAAVRFLAFSVFQVFVAYFTHNLPRQLPVLAWVATITRLPLLALPYYLWHANDSPAAQTLAMWATIVILSFWALGDGLGYVPWMEIVARAFSDRTRGRFFATTQMISGLTSILIAGILVRNILHSSFMPYPHNYAALAGLSALMFHISLVGVLLIKEPPIPRRLRGEREKGRRQKAKGESENPEEQEEQETETLIRHPSSFIPSSRPTLAMYFRRMPTLIRTNPEFARLSALQLLLGFGTAASPFYVLYAKQRFSLGDEWGGTYQVLLALSIVGLTPIWTWLSEKRGPAAAIRGLALACLLTPLSALTVGTFSPWAFGVVFLLMGGSLGWGMWIVVNNYLLTHIQEDERPLFVALINLLFAPSALYPVIGGLFVKKESFVMLAGGVPLLFVLTTVVIACGAALSLSLPNPDTSKVKEMEPV